jgi:hypothetical protein
MINKQQRYYNARENFLKLVREGGDGTAQALEEYKSASDEYRQPLKDIVTKMQERRTQR